MTCISSGSFLQCNVLFHNISYSSKVNILCCIIIIYSFLSTLISTTMFDLKDWRGWEDFLGVSLLFEEGRKVARELKGIETEEAYINLMKSKTIPDDDVASRLPYRPDLKYKNEWLGWDDFLIGN